MQQRHADSSRTSDWPRPRLTMHGVAVAVAVLVMVSGVGMWPSPIRAARMATSPMQPKPVGKFLTQPLVSDLYTADPSAHVFNGRIFIYKVTELKHRADGSIETIDAYVE